MDEYKEELLEPLKLYSYELSYKHQDNIDEYFNNATQQANVDIEGNRLTCKEYYGYLDQIKKNQNKLGNQKGLRGLLIFLTILFFLVGTIMIVLGIMKTFGNYSFIGFIIGPVLIVAGIFFIVLNSTSISKKISKFEQIIQELQGKASKKLQEANEQMASLNRLYDWGIPAKLVNKTTPIIHMDEHLSIERLSHLIENYGYKPSNKDDISTIFIQSGTLIGNPFMYERDYIRRMVDTPYTGSITISWTESIPDGKGGSRTVVHTQTLTATIVRPAARYNLDTVLIYGNEAAPKLSFSRNPSNANSMNEKQIEKFAMQTEKELHKMAENKVKTNFTPLGNAKFEGLFHAYNRDNEVEFRLLFTPLAQKNMISLITSKQPYGDDFSFIKKKMVNIVRSNHAQTLDFDGNPKHFFSFDYDKTKETFKTYNMRYFQGIFYDFAPLLSIPLYQQHRDFDYKFSASGKPHNPMLEAEVLANFFNEKIFMPDECGTHLILKAEHVKTIGKADIVNIHSYGYQLIPRIENVTKMGGDGFPHIVPVPWTEYIPVEKETPMVIIDCGGSKEEFSQNQEKIQQVVSRYSSNSDILYQRGLLSFILNDGTTSIDAKEIIDLFSHKED